MGSTLSETLKLEKTIGVPNAPIDTISGSFAGPSNLVFDVMDSAIDARRMKRALTAKGLGGSLMRAGFLFSYPGDVEPSLKSLFVGTIGTGVMAAPSVGAALKVFANGVKTYLDSPNFFASELGLN
jgi:hypothetical protein